MLGTFGCVLHLLSIRDIGRQHDGAPTEFLYFPFSCFQALAFGLD